MDFNEYLKRINCENLSNQVTFENLKRLQSQHLKEIAFENFDVHLNKYINLSIDDAYKKIIKNSGSSNKKRSIRGGYCLELNPLFAWLLKQLGYQVNYIACYLYNKNLKQYSKYTLHIALIVTIDNINYYVDVGISKPFIKYPLILEFNQIQAQYWEKYRFVNDDNTLTTMEMAANLFILEKFKHDNWLPVIKFNLKFLKLNDFAFINRLVQTNRHPTIYNRLICSKHVDNGLLLLVDSKFYEIYYDHETGFKFTNEKLLSNWKEIYEILNKKFNIYIDNSDNNNNNVLSGFYCYNNESNERIRRRNRMNLSSNNDYTVVIRKKCQEAR